MIDRETVDKIFDAADILDVVSTFVHLKKRGVNYLGLCPFHNEKTPSFTVSPSKGIYKCFGCGKGGNAVNFIMEHEQLSYAETLRYLAKRYHIEIIEKELSDQEKEKQNDRESMLIVNHFAQKTFVQNLQETTEGKTIGLSYFRERGFTQIIIKKFELGYSLKNRNGFSNLAKEKGFNKKFLVSTGLSIEKENGEIFDRFSERVMFPIHNLMGKVVGFGGRTLSQEKKIAKYLNSPESEIYHKSKLLYGMFFAKKSITQKDKCYLVEGYTDVLSMHQSGVENVVASSGTSLTVEQIKLIKRFTNNISILFDGDQAGIKAALRGIDLILQEGMNVKVLLLPQGEDPDSFAKKHNASELLEFIEKNEADFITFKTKLLLNESKNDPIEKAKFINDIVESISLIPNGIKRSVYIKECANLMDMNEEVIYAEINKKTRKRKEKNTPYQNYDKQPNKEPYNEPEKLKQTQKADSFETFEREIVRLLITYAEKILFIVEKDSKTKIEISTSEYILTEIENEITFKNPIYKLIVDECVEMFRKKETIKANHFSKHYNELVSEKAADLLSNSYTLSKIWEKKGTYLLREEDNLKQIIDQAINGYKLEQVMSLLREINVAIKSIQNDENQENKLEELYNKHSIYNQFKKEISKILGERIILKN